MVAVIELSNASWLVGGTLPGVARRPLKNLARRCLRWAVTSALRVETNGSVRPKADLGGQGWGASGTKTKLSR